MSLNTPTDLAAGRRRRTRRAALSDRPGQAAVFLTADGLARLEAQRDILASVRRPELSDRLRVAREFGDSAENGELPAAREQEEIMDGLIAHLSDVIENAVVITPTEHPDGRVCLGANVRIRTGSGVETFRILGRLEADPSAGRISNESPLGRALLGHRRRDRVTWSAPSGVHRATVLSVGD